MKWGGGDMSKFCWCGHNREDHDEIVTPGGVSSGGECLRCPVLE